MKIQRVENIPALIRLMEVTSLDLVRGGQDDDLTLGDELPAPEPAEDVNAAVSTDIFLTLMPGAERTCLILKAEGYTHASIAQITGLSDSQIRNTMSRIRGRISDRLAFTAGGHLTDTPSYRVWQVSTRSMRFTRNPRTLSPKRDFRIMRPTGSVDATGRQIYEWDIVEQGNTLSIVSYWKNAQGQGFRPSLAAMQASRVVGNIYQHPRTAARAQSQTRTSPSR